MWRVSRNCPCICLCHGSDREAGKPPIAPVLCHLAGAPRGGSVCASVRRPVPRFPVDCRLGLPQVGGPSVDSPRPFASAACSPGRSRRCAPHTAACLAQTTPSSFTDVTISVRYPRRFPSAAATRPRHIRASSGLPCAHPVCALARSGPKSGGTTACLSGFPAGPVTSVCTISAPLEFPPEQDVESSVDSASDRLPLLQITMKKWRVARHLAPPPPCPCRHLPLFARPPMLECLRSPALCSSFLIAAPTWSMPSVPRLTPTCWLSPIRRTPMPSSGPPAVHEHQPLSIRQSAARFRLLPRHVCTVLARPLAFSIYGFCTLDSFPGLTLGFFAPRARSFLPADRRTSRVPD